MWFVKELSNVGKELPVPAFTGMQTLRFLQFSYIVLAREGALIAIPDQVHGEPVLKIVHRGSTVKRIEELDRSAADGVETPD